MAETSAHLLGPRLSGRGGSVPAQPAPPGAENGGADSPARADTQARTAAGTDQRPPRHYRSRRPAETASLLESLARKVAVSVLEVTARSGGAGDGDERADGALVILPAQRPDWYDAAGQALDLLSAAHADTRREVHVRGVIDVTADLTPVLAAAGRIVLPAVRRWAHGVRDLWRPAAGLTTPEEVAGLWIVALAGQLAAAGSASPVYIVGIGSARAARQDRVLLADVSLPALLWTPGRLRRSRGSDMAVASWLLFAPNGQVLGTGAARV